VTEVDPGDRINTSTLITTLDDRSTLFVSFDIPEAFIGELAVGDEVELATWSSTKPEVNGEIVDIGSRIDPQSRTFVARARVRTDEDALRPGMSFRVQVDVQGRLYAVIAETGVQWGADGAYIWSIVDGQATRVPVQVVQRRAGRVLVDGDLKIGDVIVVEGIQQMRDGVPVSFETERLATGGTAARSPIPAIGIRQRTAALD
jgi:RND family efflux transporter MFP subunit